MNLPDAPIAHQDFFATHFFTVRDQGKSKDFRCPNSWGESAQAGKSVLHQAGSCLSGCFSLPQ
jgi:hypothetical protein